MATCTMAKVRSLGLLPTSLATRALATMFQSVTTSARADATESAAATMPGSKAADELKPDFIGRLPFSNGDTTARTYARRCEDREKVGLMSVMPADGTIVARCVRMQVRHACFSRAA